MRSRVGVPTISSPVSERIVETVARREGVEPVELEPPLYGAVDTEALDGLFDAPGDGAGGSLTVEFSYCGHDVRVTGEDVTILDGE